MKPCLRLERFARVPPSAQLSQFLFAQCPLHRSFASTSRQLGSDKSYSQPSASLDQNVTSEEKRQFEKEVAKDKDRAIRTPWHREGSDKPPVARNRSAGAMTKGKLLTTPSRLLKLILPLTTKDHNSDRKDAAPLALLMHPQQPLSYLERLIQVELPLLKDGDKEKVPTVNFSAEGSASESRSDRESRRAKDDEEDDERTSTSPPGVDAATGKSGDGAVETYSGLGHEAEDGEAHERGFVRWSKSTEMGDFIRDAARGKEFAVEIEGAPREIRVGVPSFGDRTYYLRLRLRKRSRQIASMADVKKECDMLAHKGAQRVAMAGLGGLLGWSAIVAWLTFETKLGWDVMEPVTYLVGLIGVIIGYGWFLWHNREVSYRSAMNLTVSTRQNKLYQEKGFDLQKWQMAIDDANILRREIINVANEYDVEWDEKKDTQHDKVIDALRESRHGKKGKGKDKSDDDDEEKDD